MKHTKKITSSITIIFICIFTFFNGYNMVKDGNFSYADETTENWQNVTTNAELVEAFRYYCKSRDLTIEGSASDVVTSFTTYTFNNVCNGLGIDMTALQAHLKKETDGSNIRYLFDSTGITAYNRIFAQFLQDNELEIGDTVNNNTLYSGFYLANSLVVVFSKSNLNQDISGSDIIQEGTAVNGIDSEYLYNLFFVQGSNSTYTNTFTVLNTLCTQDFFKSTSSNRDRIVSNNVGSSYYGSYVYLYEKYRPNGTINYNNGYSAILYNQLNGSLYYGFVTTYYDSGNPVKKAYLTANIPTNGETLPSANVYITTNNTTINNNNYEGDTIINNNGTPNGPDTPAPAPTPDYTPAEDWDIQLPDLDIPNWIISGKENKFPFDIPFNVMYALSLLQAEPQAPRLQGTMDFGFTTWEYDLDLSDFDTVAEICRNMEFLAFLTGLMLMTRKLIWG